MTKLFSAPLWSLVIRWFADVLAYAPIPEQTLPLRLAFKALLQYQSNSSLQQVFHTKPLVQPWYAEKVAEKNEQHEKLVDMLKLYGYDVYLRPMPLGYAGTIYNCNLLMLQDLGLQRTVAKGVLKKLHMHAITSLHNIIKERRYLENNGRYALQARSNRRNNGAG